MHQDGLLLRFSFFSFPFLASLFLVASTLLSTPCQAEGAKLVWQWGRCSAVLESASSSLETVKKLLASKNPKEKKRGQELLYESLKATLKKTVYVALRRDRGEDHFHDLFLLLLEVLPSLNSDEELLQKALELDRDQLLRSLPEEHTSRALLGGEVYSLSSSPEDQAALQEFLKTLEATAEEFRDVPQSRWILRTFLSDLDQTPDEIASRLGIPVLTVRKVLLHFRKSLGRKVGRTVESEPEDRNFDPDLN